MSSKTEKCLQLLKELAPRTSRVAVMANPDNPSFGKYMDLLRPAANQLGITLVRIASRGPPSELPQALATIKATGADAELLVGNDAALTGTPEVRQRRSPSGPWSHRLPIASSSSRLAPDGGLVSLGADNSALCATRCFLRRPNPPRRQAR